MSIVLVLVYIHELLKIISNLALRSVSMFGQFFNGQNVLFSTSHPYHEYTSSSRVFWTYRINKFLILSGATFIFFNRDTGLWILKCVNAWEKNIRIICNIFICSGIFVNENKNNRLMDVTEVWNKDSLLAFFVPIYSVVLYSIRSIFLYLYLQVTEQITCPVCVPLIWTIQWK